MLQLDPLRSAIEALIGGTATERQREELREAVASGALTMVSGERAVGLGGSNYGAIITGNTLVLSLERGGAETLQQALAGLFPPKPHLIELVARYPFPRVNEADCYVLLGVRMSEQVDRYRDLGDRPPYIPREKDGEIIAALKGPRRFVLVAGPSAAGKTRTAYEMLLRHLPDACLLVPARPEQLSALVEGYEKLADKPCEAVLWLNDLERFLQTGDPLRVITAARTRRLLIVATIRSNLLTDLRKGDEGPGREINQLLDRADIVTILDQMTGQEREHAGRLYPDVDFQEGIGESLIAGKRLRERYDNGPSELVAVVCAANDWRRAGMGRAIPAPDLNELFKSYFKRLQPRIDATTERFESGIEAACDPVVKYSVLLVKETPDSGDRRFSVPDYVSDYVASKNEPILEETWRLALRSLRTRAEGASVGDAAWFVREDIAEQAWLYGADLGDGRCARRLGGLMRRRGDLKGMEDWLRRSRDLGDGIGAYDLGVLLRSRGDVAGAKEAWQAADALDNGEAADALSILLHEEGDLKGCEAACRRAFERGEPNGALNLGNLLRERGDEMGAETIWREGVRLGSPGAAFNLGQMLRRRGDLAGARQAWRDGVRLFGAESPLRARPILGDDPETALRTIFRRATPGGEEGRALLIEFGICLARIGDLAGAERAWQEGADRGLPECVDYLWELRSPNAASYNLEWDHKEASPGWESALGTHAGHSTDPYPAKSIKQYLAAAPTSGPDRPVSRARYVIEETKSLSQSVLEQLESALYAYDLYLENLRFVKTRKVLVRVDNDRNMRPGWRSYYNPATGRIVIDNTVVSDADSSRREFTHFVLLEHRPNIREMEHPDMHLLESDLADYFVCSFASRPQFAPGVARILTLGSPYVRTLDSRNCFEEAVPASNAFAEGREVWGGAFWAIREYLGSAATDEVLAMAWRRMTVVKTGVETAPEFIEALIKSAHRRLSSTALAKMTDILWERRFPLPT